MAFMCTKFDDCSFGRSTDMIGAPKYKSGYVTETMSISGTICRP